MNTKNYESYTARDFAQDESFQEWVLSPNIKSTVFWETWVHDHPGSKTSIEDAIALVRSLRFRNYNLSNKEKDQVWDGIWDKIDIEEGGETLAIPTKTRRASWWNTWKYAAAVLIAVLGIVAIWRTTNNQAEKLISFNVDTKPGEVKKVTLPDSSEVILNANSEVVYSENNRMREAWLKGEAYFHVKHTKDSKAFIVHTYDDLSVKVLGTRFNVNTFNNQVSVVLEQGSIEAAFSGNSENQKSTLYLKPGERVEYNKAPGDFSKSRIDPNRFVSWTKSRLIMDHYTLRDARSFMQNVFSKELIINDSDLLAEAISGSMPIVYNLDTMLVQFSKAFQVDFYKHGNEIRIRR